MFLYIRLFFTKKNEYKEFKYFFILKKVGEKAKLRAGGALLHPALEWPYGPHVTFRSHFY